MPRSEGGEIRLAAEVRGSNVNNPIRFAGGRSGEPVCIDYDTYHEVR